MKNEAHKDLFLATLGHELRNPLASANNLIARGVGDQAVAHRMLATHTTQLTRLVDDLLDVARVRAGEIFLDKRRINLATVATAAVEGTQERISAKGQQLNLQAPAELPVVAQPRAERSLELASRNSESSSTINTLCSTIILWGMAAKRSQLPTLDDTANLLLPGRIFKAEFATFSAAARNRRSALARFMRSPADQETRSMRPTGQF